MDRTVLIIAWSDLCLMQIDKPIDTLLLFTLARFVVMAEMYAAYFSQCSHLTAWSIAHGLMRSTPILCRSRIWPYSEPALSSCVVQGAR
jgi:hypothetical protein